MKKTARTMFAFGILALLLSMIAFARDSAAVESEPEAKTEAKKTVVIPGYSGKAMRAAAGDYIRLTDVEGMQVGDLFAVSADDHTEFSSPSVTRLYNLNLFPKVGQSFYTNKDRPVLTFVEDHSPGIHDMLMASCNKKFFEAYGFENHPNCRDNYFKAAAEAGIEHTFKPDPINFFQNTPVLPDKSIVGGVTMTQPGDYVVLQAKMDIILIVTACSTEQINGCKSSPLRIEIFEQRPE